jgi:hypothetical protein
MEFGVLITNRPQLFVRGAGAPTLKLVHAIHAIITMRDAGAAPSNDVVLPPATK